MEIINCLITTCRIRYIELQYDKSVYDRWTHIYPLITFHLIKVFLCTASLKPKSVSVKVPRKGALNIDKGRYGDSKNGFG